MTHSCACMASSMTPQKGSCRGIRGVLVGKDAQLGDGRESLDAPSPAHRVCHALGSGECVRVVRPTYMHSTGSFDVESERSLCKRYVHVKVLLHVSWRDAFLSQSNIVSNHHQPILRLLSSLPVQLTFRFFYTACLSIFDFRSS